MIIASRLKTILRLLFSSKVAFEDLTVFSKQWISIVFPPRVMRIRPEGSDHDETLLMFDRTALYGIGFSAPHETASIAGRDAEYWSSFLSSSPFAPLSETGEYKS